MLELLFALGNGRSLVLNSFLRITLTVLHPYLTASLYLQFSDTLAVRCLLFLAGLLWSCNLLLTMCIIIVCVGMFLQLLCDR